MLRTLMLATKKRRPRQYGTSSSLPLAAWLRYTINAATGGIVTYTAMVWPL